MTAPAAVPTSATRVPSGEMRAAKVEIDARTSRDQR